jgi:uncharacterized protein (DUF427 family)
VQTLPTRVRLGRDRPHGPGDDERTVDVAKATWNGAVIAESEDIVTVEGNAYFPRSAVKDEYLRPSAHTSHCPWKGDASYFSLEVDGSTNADAVWYYPTPKDAAKEITDRVAFWKGVVVEA